jgi:hypothetical protein
MTARLYTFTIPHFAEKARWALDYKGIRYQEKRFVPGSHLPVVKHLLRRCLRMEFSWSTYRPSLFVNRGLAAVHASVHRHRNS